MKKKAKDQQRIVVYKDSDGNIKEVKWLTKQTQISPPPPPPTTTTTTVSSPPPSPPHEVEQVKKIEEVKEVKEVFPISTTGISPQEILSDVPFLKKEASRSDFDDWFKRWFGALPYSDNRYSAMITEWRMLQNAVEILEKQIRDQDSLRGRYLAIKDYIQSQRRVKV